MGNQHAKPPTKEIPAITCIETDSASLETTSSTRINIIVGKYLSKRLVSVAASFWLECVQSAAIEDKLEIGCSLFFTMFSTNKQMGQLMQQNFPSDTKLENTSLKYLEMLGWLLRSLQRTDVDLYSLLTKLGTLHQKMGIKLSHFNIMIQSLHETMYYYFTKQYNIDVQYAMEEIITLAARIMTGELNVEHNTDVVIYAKRSQSHMERTTAFHGVNTMFLESLEVCLLSEIGREYFYRYLHQNWCSELTVYLELINKFKNQTTDKQRYIVAKDLIKECISTNARFAINISYETRTNLLDSFYKLNDKKLTVDYCKDVEMEMRRLIIKNHWSKFVYSVGELHNSANIDYLLH